MSAAPIAAAAVEETWLAKFLRARSDLPLRWVVVTGPEDAPVVYEPPGKPGVAGCWESLEFAERLAAVLPGGRVMDANAWMAGERARRAREREGGGMVRREILRQQRAHETPPSSPETTARRASR